MSCLTQSQQVQGTVLGNQVGLELFAAVEMAQKDEVEMAQKDEVELAQTPEVEMAQTPEVELARQVAAAHLG